MISKTDCLLALTKLQAQGVDVSKQLTDWSTNYSANAISIYKFINNQRQLDVVKFYEHIRNSYNNHRSKLYYHIVACDKLEPTQVLSTLASLQLQLTLFAEREVEDKASFYQSSSLAEIAETLSNYYKNFDINKCQELLTRFRADIKLLEQTYR